MLAPAYEPGEVGASDGGTSRERSEALRTGRGGADAGCGGAREEDATGDTADMSACEY